jgi:hypothetical protein
MGSSRADAVRHGHPTDNSRGPLRGRRADFPGRLRPGGRVSRAGGERHRIRDLKRDGMTMVLATHEMGFAREVADRVCFLDAGRILEQGPPAKVFDDPENPRTRQFLGRLTPG